MRIIVFGIGKYFHNRKEKLQELLCEDEIIAYIDNHASSHEKIDGKSVLYPDEINKISCDVIILMSIHNRAMRTQLQELNIDNLKIWSWEKYAAHKTHGKFQVYIGDERTNGKKILIMSHVLSYGGGQLAVIYAAQAIMNRGYTVFIAAPSGEKKFIDEMVRKGFNFIICPAFLYMGKEELYFIKQFDVVMANVFPMISCACEMSKVRPVLWWIHENSERFDTAYRDTRDKFSEYDNVQSMEKVNIVAVSNIAKKNFEQYYPNRIDSILPFGIPDEAKSDGHDKSKEKLVFAIIGLVCERKAQMIFLEAIEMMNAEERDQCEFWIIGQNAGGEYCNAVKEKARAIPEVKMKGQLTREEIKLAFCDIDVVVCASLEETMSITVVEGMMHSKVCITTDATGVADYISDKENGFVCRAGDVEALYRRMIWIVRNKHSIDSIRNKARSTYENNFSMEQFGEKLEEQIKETQRRYENNIAGDMK